jgi:hypothetical protein
MAERVFRRKAPKNVTGANKQDAVHLGLPDEELIEWRLALGHRD